MGWLAAGMAGWLPDRLASRPSGWLNRWMSGWTDVWLAGCLAGCLAAGYGGLRLLVFVSGPGLRDSCLQPACLSGWPDFCLPACLLGMLPGGGQLRRAAAGYGGLRLFGSGLGLAGSCVQPACTATQVCGRAFG